MSRKAKLAERIVYAAKATKVARASRLGIALSGVLIFLIFAIAYYGEVVGNFTFKVDRKAFQAGITLFHDPINKKYTSRLIADKVDKAYAMTAFCGTEYSDYFTGEDVCLPPDEELTSVYGSNNGESYLVYTFFVENAGLKIVDLEASITLIQATRGAEQSLRVRLIINDNATTYALPQSQDGANPGMPEIFTQPFISPYVVMNRNFTAFQPEESFKVTVVLWYEGEDVDHNINILGGGVKLDMTFSITYIYDENEDVPSFTTTQTSN